MSFSPDVIEFSLEKNSTHCTVKKYNTTTKMSTVGLVKIEDISNIFSIEKPLDTEFIQNLLGISSAAGERITFFYYPSIFFDYSHYLYENPLKVDSIEFENHNISFDSTTNILKITNIELKNNIAIIGQNSEGNVYKTFFGNYFNNNISNFISNDTEVIRYPLYNYYQAFDTVCWPRNFDLNSYFNNFNKQSTLIYSYLNSIFNFDLNYHYLTNNIKFFEKDYRDKILKLYEDNFVYTPEEVVPMLTYLLASGDEKLLFSRNSDFFSNHRANLSSFKVK